MVPFKSNLLSRNQFYLASIFQTWFTTVELIITNLFTALIFTFLSSISLKVQYLFNLVTGSLNKTTTAKKRQKSMFRKLSHSKDHDQVIYCIYFRLDESYFVQDQRTQTKYVDSGVWFTLEKDLIYLCVFRIRRSCLEKLIGNNEHVYYC